jgi:hypothetical protein
MSEDAVIVSDADDNNNHNNNNTNTNPQKLLSLAAYCDIANTKTSTEMCRLLLATQQFDLIETDAFGFNALHYASYTDKVQVVEMLVQEYSDLDMTTPDNNDAIYKASSIHSLIMAMNYFNSNNNSSNKQRLSTFGKRPSAFSVVSPSSSASPRSALTSSAPASSSTHIPPLPLASSSFSSTASSSSSARPKSPARSSSHDSALGAADIINTRIARAHDIVDLLLPLSRTDHATIDALLRCSLRHGFDTVFELVLRYAINNFVHAEMIQSLVQSMNSSVPSSTVLHELASVDFVGLIHSTINYATAKEMITITAAAASATSLANANENGADTQYHKLYNHNKHYGDDGGDDDDNNNTSDDEAASAAAAAAEVASFRHAMYESEVTRLAHALPRLCTLIIDRAPKREDQRRLFLDHKNRDGLTATMIAAQRNLPIFHSLVFTYACKCNEDDNFLHVVCPVWDREHLEMFIHALNYQRTNLYHPTHNNQQHYHVQKKTNNITGDSHVKRKPSLPSSSAHTAAVGPGLNTNSQKPSLYRDVSMIPAAALLASAPPPASSRHSDRFIRVNSFNRHTQMTIIDQLIQETYPRLSIAGTTTGVDVVGTAIIANASSSSSSSSSSYSTATDDHTQQQRSQYVRHRREQVILWLLYNGAKLPDDLDKSQRASLFQLIFTHRKMEIPSCSVFLSHERTYRHITIHEGTGGVRAQLRFLLPQWAIRNGDLQLLSIILQPNFDRHKIKPVMEHEYVWTTHNNNDISNSSSNNVGIDGDPIINNSRSERASLLLSCCDEQRCTDEDGVCHRNEKVLELLLQYQPPTKEDGINYEAKDAMTQRNALHYNCAALGAATASFVGTLLSSLTSASSSSPSSSLSAVTLGTSITTSSGSTLAAPTMPTSLTPLLRAAAPTAILVRVNSDGDEVDDDDGRNDSNADGVERMQSVSHRSVVSSRPTLTPGTSVGATVAGSVITSRPPSQSSSSSSTASSSSLASSLPPLVIPFFPHAQHLPTPSSTALHLACTQGNWRCVSSLLHAYATTRPNKRDEQLEIDIRDADEQTPLTTAMMRQKRIQDAIKRRTAGMTQISSLTGGGGNSKLSASSLLLPPQQLSMTSSSSTSGSSSGSNSSNSSSSSSSSSNLLPQLKREEQRYKQCVNVLLKAGASVDHVSEGDDGSGGVGTCMEQLIDVHTQWKELDDKLLAAHRNNNDALYNSLLSDKMNQILIDVVYRTYVRIPHLVRLFKFVSFVILLTLVGIYSTTRDTKSSFYLHDALEQAFISSFIDYSVSPLPKTYEDMNGKDEFWYILSLSLSLTHTHTHTHTHKLDARARLFTLTCVLLHVCKYRAWMKGNFVNNVYANNGSASTYFYEGVSQPRSRFSYLLEQNRVIGVPQLRQVRSRLTECDFMAGYDKYRMKRSTTNEKDVGEVNNLAPYTCMKSVSSWWPWWDESDTASFGPGVMDDDDTTKEDADAATSTSATANNGKDEKKSNDSSFTLPVRFDFHSEHELDNWRYWGRYNRYPGSGFIVNFPDLNDADATDNAGKLVEHLEKINWIDAQTR